jgi:Carbohydrate binding module (family 6).
MKGMIKSMLKKIITFLLVFGMIAGYVCSSALVNAAAGDPGKIEAESYTSMFGIKTEGCSEGGLNVGYTDAGDWMDYSINVQNSGSYDVQFRVSSLYTDSKLQLLSGTEVLATVTVPNTGGWQKWQTVTATVNLNAGSQTLRVKAVTNGWNINWMNIISSGSMEQVETPVISPATGTYNSVQNVTISCATAGAAIKYTTDGSTPTAASTAYTGAITVAQTTTVKAIAVKEGMNDSNVAATEYVINIPVAEGKSIPGTIEAESYNSSSAVGTEPCSEGGQNVGWIDKGDYLNYVVNVAQTGTYTVQFRVASPNASATVQLKSGDKVLSTSTITNTGSWQNWKTVTAAVQLTAGVQTLTLYTAVGGFNVNWLNFIYGEPVPQVDTPTFSPAGGTYPEAQDVTISCATAGATIKYTMDGTTPTASSQTYAGPLHIASTTSVKAIAFKEGMTNSEVAATTFNISRSKGVMDFEIKNGTRGTFGDNEIYWAVLGLNSDKKLCYLDADGNLVPTSTALNDAPGHLTKNGQNYANIYHKLSEVPLVSTPAISSGRMFLSVGTPCYIKVYDNGYAGPDVNNPTDPNNDVYWDFVEFTLDAGGYHGNTTRVDAFGFPITHRLICADGYDRTVGETETREALFNEYANEVPAEFKTLVKAPYRILAPCKGGFKAGGPYANYFDSYVNQVWHETTAKPTTQDILLGIGGAADPKICAALNRGVYTDPAHWADPNYFYQITPSNYYSKFWHDHSIDGLSYGFCYDDVNNFAAYLEHNNPVRLVITVGW